MRRLFGFTLAALVVCVMAGNEAMAQGGRGGFGGGGFGGGLTFLVQNEQVQKELKITDDQKTKIKEIADASRPQPGAGGGRARGTPPTEEQIAEMRKRTEETNAKITAVLSADQNARLKQIQLWTQGTRALTNNADVQKELALTDEQKSALKTITDESQKKSRELFGSAGRNATQEERTAAREKMTALQKETDTECMAVLTAAQKTKLETMKGAEFKLDMTAFGGGRGRRGGNNNN